MTTEEKLKHFEEASLKQAREQSEQMLTEYRASLKKLEQEHQAEKKNQAKLMIQTETLSLKRAENMTLSKKRMEIKRQLIKKHNELKDKLFTEVTALLAAFMKTPEYEELLLRQIQNILAYAGDGEVTIYIDPADEDKIAALSKTSGVPLTLSSYSFMGGIRAVLAENRILIDYSFATRLAEEKDKFTFDGGNIHG